MIRSFCGQRSEQHGPRWQRIDHKTGEILKQILGIVNFFLLFCQIMCIIPNNYMNNSITSALCLLLLTASCAIDEGNIETEKEKATDIIAAYMENPEGSDTRLELDSSNNLLWQEGDKISIVGTSSAEFTLSSGKGTQSGTFTGNMSGAGSAPYFAVMPKDNGAKVIDNAVVFSIPQQKGAQRDNIAKSTNPMAGKVSGGSVQFHNLFGLLKLTFTSSPSVTIKKITLHDLGGNMLWGTCTIPILADTLAYSNMTLSGGNNTINMVWNSPATFGSKARSYYFAVPPGSLDRGFSVVMYEYDSTKDDGIGRAYTFIQKISNPIAAQRSVIINMEAVAMSEKSEPADPKARGYYKSLFVDGGYELSSYYRTSDFEWLTTLNLANDYEYFATSDTPEGQSKQTEIITTSSIDANGTLLYPDGKPRFRMVYVNGGSSSAHGRSLYQSGCRRFHDFYYNGGSYVGTCAGSFFATKYAIKTSGIEVNCFDNPDTTYNYYCGIWPGTIRGTGMPRSIKTYKTIYSAMNVLPALKELGYEATNDTVELVRHHGGSYMPHTPRNMAITNREELTSYRYSERVQTGFTPDSSYMKCDDYSYTYNNLKNLYMFGFGEGRFVSKNDSTSIWAYKHDAATGRAILCGSHPEREKTGAKLSLMETMVKYALAGSGDPTVKGDFKLGDTRLMTKNTTDEDPDYTMIGDRQYHHFTFTTTRDITNFFLALNTYSDGVNLYLALRKGAVAWLSDADYVICTKGGNKALNVKNLPAGQWYIAVYCATTVDATAVTSNPYYFEYSGTTSVLNGTPYTLTTSIDGTQAIPLSGLQGEQLVGASTSFDD